MPVSRNQQHEQDAVWFHVRHCMRLQLCGKIHGSQGLVVGQFAILREVCHKEYLLALADAGPQ